jgi:glyoxylase-like metal-dependent hydrolase (beta-lactamase superfamily II)
MVVLVSERSQNESSVGGDGGGGGGKPLFMVSGDTLFPGSCGRVDLPESDPVQMWDSLQIVKGYSDDLVVFPGHAYSGSNTTIGKESRNGLLGMTKKEWMRGR